MTEHRNVTVKYPNGTRPTGDEPIVHYGQAFTAAAFDSVLIADPPRDEADWRWIRDDLAVRVSPEGSITFPNGTSA